MGANIKFTKEEKDILRRAESGDFGSSKNLKKDLSRYAKIATLTTAKNKLISIRISEADLMKIKTLALREGMPYQTLISSSLHKLVAR